METGGWPPARSDPSPPGGTAPDWAAAFPSAALATRERLRRVRDTFERLEQNPLLVPVERHLEALEETARIVAAVLHDPRLHTALELRFVHAGQECNCPIFELFHRAVYAAERLLWHAHTADTGGPGSAGAAALPPAQRLARHASLRRLLGVLALTERLCRGQWLDQPPALRLPLPYLDELRGLLRAYALWNVALAGLPGPLDGLSLDALRTATAALAECHRALAALAPGPLSLAGDLWRVQLPTALGTAALAAADEPRRASPPGPPSAAAALRPWNEAVQTTFLHVLAQRSAALDERGAALALGRVLEARGERVPQLDVWERMNEKVYHQKVLRAEALAAFVAAVEGLPEVLREGVDPRRGAAPLVLDTRCGGSGGDGDAPAGPGACGPPPARPNT